MTNELIGCRTCSSPGCKGCNMFTLYKALKLARDMMRSDAPKSLSIPAVDAVEVVRCRECKHGAYSEYYGNVACNAHLWVRGPEYFCADGQRREDGEA